MSVSTAKLIAKKLTGDELFVFQGPRGIDQYITAKDLRLYVGGDAAQPAIAPERGAHSIRMGEFPNAARRMGDADAITGLQDGYNVNFNKRQIAPDGITGSIVIENKVIILTNGVITEIRDR